MIKSIFKIFIFSAFILGFNYCDQEISRTPEDTPPPTSLIFIDSNPPNSQIFIDGKNTNSVTPDTIKLFEARSFQVTLKKDLYSDTSFVHTAERGYFGEYFIDYLKNPLMLGRFNCFSVPEDVDIILNGENTGLKTPDTLKYIIPGEYHLIFKKEGYIETLKTEKAISNTTVDVFVIMKNNPGK